MSGRKLALSVLLTSVSGSSMIVCAGQTAVSPGRAVKKLAPAERGGALVVTVGTDKKIYTAGAPIKLTLTARNATREAVHLTFSSGQKFDFEIRRGAKSGGPLIWQWAREKNFIQMLSGDTLEPNKARTYHAVFDPKSAAKTGKPFTMTPGTYTVIGALMTLQQAGHPSGVTTYQIK